MLFQHTCAGAISEICRVITRINSLVYQRPNQDYAAKVAGRILLKAFHLPPSDQGRNTVFTVPTGLYRRDSHLIGISQVRMFMQQPALQNVRLPTLHLRREGCQYCLPRRTLASSWRPENTAEILTARYSTVVIYDLKRRCKPFTSGRAERKKRRWRL